MFSIKGVESRSRLVFRIPQCVGIGFSGAQESASTIENGNPKAMTLASLVNFVFAIVSSKSESVSVHYIEVPRRAGNSRQRKSGTGQSESGTKPHWFQGGVVATERRTARADSKNFKQGAFWKGGYIDEGVFASQAPRKATVV